MLWVVCPKARLNEAAFEVVHGNAYGTEDVLVDSYPVDGGMQPEVNVRHFSRNELDIDVEGDCGRVVYIPVLHRNLGGVDADIAFVVGHGEVCCFSQIVAVVGDA